MILSNLSIHESLDKKWLMIDPEPEPRRVMEGGPVSLSDHCRGFTIGQ